MGVDLSIITGNVQIDPPAPSPSCAARQTIPGVVRPRFFGRETGRSGLGVPGRIGSPRRGRVTETLRLPQPQDDRTMAKGKKKLEVVHLVCEETGDQNYTLRRKTGGEKLKVKKYSPRLRKHTVHNEKRK